jgi:di/tripeptidase
LIEFYQSGNTLKFIATFHDWINNLVDPTSVTFKLLNHSMEVLETFDATTTPAVTKKSTGVYELIHTVDTPGTYIYEFCGTIDGTPSLKRGEITVVNVW